MRSADCKILFAVVLVMATLPVGAQPKRSTNHQQANSAQSQSQAAEKPQPVITALTQSEIERIARALKAISTANSTSEKPDYASQNLQAQKGMATNSGLMFRVALADTIITFFGILLVAGTLVAAWISAREAGRAAKEAKRQADVAEDSATKLERPHLFIENPRIMSRTQGRLHPQVGVFWAGGLPGFDAEYDIFNYGRSPAILVSRSATIFIGSELPEEPAVNRNDIFTDPIAVPERGNRKGWHAFWRGSLTDEMIDKLRLGRHVGIKEGLKAYLFVRLVYTSVYGKTDEIGAIWEYLIDIDKFVVPDNELPNYNYRKLGN